MPGTATSGIRCRSVPLLRSALLFAAASSLVPGAAAAQVSGGYEEGIVEIVAERLAPLATVVLIDSAGSVLLPLEHVTHYLGLTTSWSDGMLIIPEIGGGTVRVDTVTGILTTRSGSVQLAPAELVRRHPNVYLRTERLAELLGAGIRLEFATLTVFIARTAPFPAQQRVIAEQRRAMVLARQKYLNHDDRTAAVPYAPLTGAGIADWEVSTNGLDPSRLTTARLHTGIALLGGDLNGGGALEIGRDADDALRDITLRYHRVFPQGRYLTQMRAGDVLTGGLFARFVRGIELTNRPFLRTGELSSVVVEPDLPAGWEYEVFQGNQLLGYSQPGSVDPVAVPLRTGTTPVQVRMYGPAGEEVVTTLLYQTPMSLLRRDAVEYSLGAGSCASTCDEFVHADVRYGASSLFTVGGGLELFTDSTGSSIRPYFVYSMASGVRATAEFTYMPFALYSTSIALFPRDGSTAHLRGSISRPGFGPISLISEPRMRWDAEAHWDERIEFDSPFSQLRFGMSAAGLPGQLERWRISSTASYNRGFLEARYDHDNSATSPHLLSGRAAVFTPFTIGSHSLRPLLTSAVGIGAAGFRLAEFGVSLQPRANAIITAGAQWSRGSSRPTLSIGYSARTGSIQSALRAVSSASGVASSSIMMSGSSAFAGDGSVTLQPSARTGYAGVHGVVFVDRNGDGVFSDGDDVIPDTHLVIGGHRQASDARGRFRVWGLQPYEAVTVAIDSASTPDPSWTTGQNAIVIRPVPNMAMWLDIPVIRTRELIGTLTASTDVATIAGLSLDITHLDTGTITTTVTFSDGLFYVNRVRPGRYRIAVSPSSLAALDALATPAATEFVIPAVGDEPVVELAPIHLERRK